MFLIVNCPLMLHTWKTSLGFYRLLDGFQSILMGLSDFIDGLAGTPWNLDIDTGIDMGAEISIDIEIGMECGGTVDF